MSPKVVRQTTNDPTANNLMVGSTTNFTHEEWNKARVIEKLTDELGIKPEVADSIATAVEKKVVDAGLETVTTAEIRTLTQAELLSRGMRAKWRKGSLAVMSFRDLSALITGGNQENSNVPHNPEAINLYIGENIKKQFALDSGEVFSKEVATAHKDGYMHLHDLGLVDRPYCSGQNLAYVIRYGLSSKAYPNPSKPAKHLLVLINHIKEFSSLLQGHFAGAIGWDAVNIFMAPFVQGVSDEVVKQSAQDMIFSFSQLLGTRGGQAIFSDLNFYYETPPRYKDTFALGPGGRFIHKWIDKLGESHTEFVRDLPKNAQMFKHNMKDGFLTYGDYTAESRRFLRACIEVYKDGDANGLPFFFPKANVHITKDFWRTDNHEGHLELISEAVAKTGSLYLVFERGDTNVVSQCCRLRVNMSDDEVETAKHEPWRMRFAALQNITLNLPRFALEAKQAGSYDLPELEKIFTERLDKYFATAVDAHIQKKKFINKLLALKEHGPLATLTYDQDGAPYFGLGSARYLIGVLGLNEAVQELTGKQLHEDQQAFELGLKIVSHMYIACQRLSKEHKMNIALEQTPAESTAYRFAKLDLEKYPDAKKLVKGDVKTGSVYYTNSTHIAVDANVSLVDRILLEGQFHGAIDAGSITHAWMGDATPDVKAVASFITKIYDLSQNDQVVFSPTFTRCNDCSTVEKGELDACKKCSSENVTYITRVTGYYGESDKWNKGKQQEREDRKQHNDRSLGSPVNVNIRRDKAIHLYGKPGCSICKTTDGRIQALLKKMPGKYEYHYHEFDIDKHAEATDILTDMLMRNVRDIPALVIGNRTWSVKMPTDSTIEGAIQEELK